MTIGKAALALGVWVSLDGELPPDMAPWDAEAYAVGLALCQQGFSLQNGLIPWFGGDLAQRILFRSWRRRYAEGWLDAQRVAKQRGTTVPTAVAQAFGSEDVPLGGGVG